MSDTRTNSGVDNISQVPKTRIWDVPGDRVITLMSAGNLATTQTVISMLDERSMLPEDRNPSILSEPTMFQVARLVADTLKEVVSNHEQTGARGSNQFGATLILGGQIVGMAHRLFLIYPEGNFIEATTESPFFQIGETKYGRPILIRGLSNDMRFEQAVKLLTVSFDSTMQANLSVGMPLDLHVYEADSFERGIVRRFDEDDAYYSAISQRWSASLQTALEALPDFSFED